VIENAQQMKNLTTKDMLDFCGF